MKTNLLLTLLLAINAFAATPKEMGAKQFARTMKIYHFGDYSKDALPRLAPVASADVLPELPGQDARRDAATNEPPQTFPITLAWDRQLNVSNYTLIVGDFMVSTATNVVSDVPVLFGTNAVTCTAVNASGFASTNKIYLLVTHRDIAPKAFSADSPLGPHTTLTALPGVITDPVTDKFFGWDITETTRLAGQLLP